MLLAPFIISLIFAVAILISPFIIKAVFKFSDFMGYCKGFCASVISAIIITVCGLIAILVMIFVALDGIDRNANDFYSLFKQIAIGYLLLALAFVLAIYISVFFVLLCFSKGVCTPQFSFSSIFMFISGYITFMFLECYFAIMIVAATTTSVTQNIQNQRIQETANTAASSYYVLLDFILFGFILQLTGVCIMFMLYHRNINGKMFLLIAAGFFFGPLLFDIIGVFSYVIELIEYPIFIFEIGAFVTAIVFYCKYANQNVQTGGALIANSNVELR